MDKVRKKLERARSLVGWILDVVGDEYPLVAEKARIVHSQISEVLDLTESQPDPTREEAESEDGEQVRKDHAAMEALRGYAATGARPLLVFDDCGNWALTFAGIQPVVEEPDGAAMFVLRATWATDPADAILVDPQSEKVEPDEGERVRCPSCLYEFGVEGE
ncbi:MAG: hypothetical protein QGD93_02710 [Actinomycetota bacterium]|nr:hypothetical protein [Actinomycetota bacterium]